jgi:hypothetical protein
MSFVWEVQCAHAPAARRILALKSNLRTLEEALGAILDVVGNDDYPLDEDLRELRLAYRNVVDGLPAITVPGGVSKPTNTAIGVPVGIEFLITEP